MNWTKMNIYTGAAIFEPPKDKGQVVRQYVAENGLTFEESYGVGDTESDRKFWKSSIIRSPSIPIRI